MCFVDRISDLLSSCFVRDVVDYDGGTVFGKPSGNSSADRPGGSSDDFIVIRLAVPMRIFDTNGQLFQRGVETFCSRWLGVVEDVRW